MFDATVYKAHREPTSTFIRFLRLLCGEYSNEEQAFNNPPLYSHILISYRPLPQLKRGSLLLHQAYAVTHTSPYRLRVVRVESYGNKTLKIWNHRLKVPKYFNMAISDATLRNQIRPEDLILLEGCHYIVQENADGFHGSLEEDCQCLVQRNGQETYLVSEFELNSSVMKTTDRGHDLQTHKHLWGSIAGAFWFQRTVEWTKEIPQHWLMDEVTKESIQLSDAHTSATTSLT